ncbi:MAG: DUF423 domain-containing protein [Thermoanaerobaculia bacterium]|nr:DUF423 domain-containing protein [Thermoanaerobaculia bacterium]
MSVDWIAIGALGAALAIVLGAFGAHALEERLSDRDMVLWETAARYLMYAALGLLVMGVLSRSTSVPVDWPAATLAAGGLLFCATVAAIALGGPRWLGAVTPFGGLLMIVGWFLLAWASIRS